jgi:hypothetical protein
MDDPDWVTFEEIRARSPWSAWWQRRLAARQYQERRRGLETTVDRPVVPSQNTGAPVDYDG